MKKVVRHRVVNVPKLKEREHAINLREQGLSYSEILEKVPVAKSTLSVWLGAIGLTTKQKQRLTEKKLSSMRRGSATRRRQRIERTTRIEASARKDFVLLKREPLFLLGLALYWAEGSKQKAWNVSQLVAFSNMDSRAHRLMLLWVHKYFHIHPLHLKYEIYLHESASVTSARSFWSQQLHIPKRTMRVYFKSNNPKSKRHNQHASYHGVLRFVVPKSTDMNRRIAAWIESVLEFLT